MVVNASPKRNAGPQADGLLYVFSATRWHHETMALHITGDTAADTLLTNNPLALLVGMLLDQQVR